MPNNRFLDFAQAGKSLPQLVEVEKRFDLTREQKTSLRVALELISESGRLMKLCKEEKCVDQFFCEANEELVSFEFFVFLSCVFVSRVRNNPHLGNSRLSETEVIEAMLSCIVLGGEITESIVPGLNASRAIAKRNFFLGVEGSCVELISNLYFAKEHDRLRSDEGKESIKLCTLTTSALLGILNSYLALDGRARIDKIENMFLQMVGVGNIAPGYNKKSVTII